MRMEISSAMRRANRQAKSIVLIIPAVLGLTLSACADPDFGLALTSPEDTSKSVSSIQSALCKDTLYSIQFETTPFGKINSVTFGADGEAVSDEINDFLTRNMSAFPATYNLVYLGCSDGRDDEDRMIELQFSGIRHLNEANKTGAIDVFDYKVRIEGAHVASQLSQSLGQRVITSFQDYAKEHNLKGVSGLYDIGYCANGAPCKEFARSSDQ